MTPVVGVDVSKSFSVAFSYLKRNEPLGSALTFQHTNEGFTEFINLLKKTEIAANQKPSIILEPTGHYHLGIMDLLQKNNYNVVLINPLVSKYERYSTLRREKTDIIDAQKLGDIYYKLELQPVSYQTDELFRIRFSTRTLSMISKNISLLKTRTGGILDIIFPYYKDAFYDIYCKYSIEFLKSFPSAKSVLNTDKEDILDRLCFIYNIKDRQAVRVNNKLNQLLEAALKCPIEQDVYDSHIHSLLTLLELIEQYQEQYSLLQKHISESIYHRKDYNILLSIPGIGEVLAATILSEIGDVSNFDSAKKLIAFAGIEPSVYQSGKFKSSQNKISKRGSHYLRRSLYIAVSAQLRKSSRCDEIRDFYYKKKTEGKHHNVAMIACSNKLLRIIYALLTKQEYYHQ